jgi:hypothetical protein
MPLAALRQAAKALLQPAKIHSAFKPLGEQSPNCHFFLQIL